MAEQPTIAADRVKPLDIGDALRARGCGDVTAVVVSGLPPGASLSAGQDNGDGSWTLAPGDLDGLTATPPADQFDDVTLTVSAAVGDPADPGAPPITTAFGLTLALGPPPDVVAEPPTAMAAAEADAVARERTVVLDIDVGLDDDAPRPVSVAIGGIPAGAMLSVGADDGTGTWVLDASALAGLTLSLPAGAPDRLTLGIAATAADGTSAAGVLSLVVSELPDAPPEPPLPAIGPEPTFEPVFEPGPEPEPVSEPQPEPEFTAEEEAEPENVAEPVFTPDFVPEFVADFETDDEAPPPPPPSPPPGAARPIAYWKLDEQRAGRVGDEIAGRYGRAHGVAEGASGPFASVDAFDGIDDYIAVPAAADLAPAAGTLTVWFNAYAGGQAAIAAKGAEAGAHLRLAVAGRRLRLVLGDGETVHVAQGGSFGAAEWNQATATWGPAGMAIYLNGERVAAVDYAGGLAGNDAPWLFGAADPGDGALGDFFHGELDDIALYGEQLDAAAVRRLFQLGVIGLMSGDVDAAPPGDADVMAAGDSGLDLDAIPAEAEGLESLATLDAVDDAEAAEPVPPTADTDDDGDSGLDLDAIPAEAEGPGSLATLDAVADAAAVDDDGVFVFGAGGDYFQGGDGWADMASPPTDDEPAVEIAADGELTLAGGDKLEW